MLNVGHTFWMVACTLRCSLVTAGLVCSASLYILSGWGITQTYCFWLIAITIVRVVEYADVKEEHVQWFIECTSQTSGLNGPSSPSSWRSWSHWRSGPHWRSRRPHTYRCLPAKGHTRLGTSNTVRLSLVLRLSLSRTWPPIAGNVGNSCWQAEGVLQISRPITSNPRESLSTASHCFCLNFGSWICALHTINSIPYQNLTINRPLTDSPKMQSASENWRRRGIWAAWLIGGAGVSLLALSIPFTLPGLRKYCLPYVPATPIQIEKILCELRGRRGKVVDLGSGDGRVVSSL